MAEPEISVVVPARGAAASLPALLASLESQTIARERFELVVAVNGGDADGTAEVAGAWGARVVTIAAANRSLARNAGVEAATARLVAFTDADCTATPEWLASLTGCLAAAPLAAGPIEPTAGTPPSTVERFEQLWRFRQRQHVETVGWAATGNLGITREAFEAIGGFDSSFVAGGEDVELCLRARRAGMEIAWCPDATVHHPAESTWTGLLRRAARHGYVAAHHHSALPEPVGRLYRRHPRPLARGDWALRRFGIDPGSLEPTERRAMMRAARAEYAARIAGSVWAKLTRTG